MLQRIGWTTGMLFLAAAMSGLLGGEAASRRSARSEDGSVRIDFDRFCRSGKPIVFEIRARHIADDSPLTIGFSGAFADALEIRDVRPAPVRSEARADGVALVFAAPGPSALIRVRCDVRGAGRAGPAIKVGPAPELRMRQFIFP